MFQVEALVLNKADTHNENIRTTYKWKKQERNHGRKLFFGAPTQLQVEPSFEIYSWRCLQRQQIYLFFSQKCFHHSMDIALKYSLSLFVCVSEKLNRT